ncbi:radical SAM protein [Allostreptomyces psammosilenae]|uniref:Cyclic pyranopterin phosphate synthase n=1 Tax=Allostreptomyces psammosilenae TaxID=1892865 RepID=A0A852ZWS2_9ACTN|nr:radical SAM protein [Allostreptomyces psammosilenae]NYI05700.1 cyclic pyranopterin phosphate synthase [Allostreptomyces psammosilenae]
MTEEQPLPVEVRRDRTLRVKVIDACGLRCTFCHNEGTPVSVDNVGETPGRYTGAPTRPGRTGRVSIYLATNGADFLPARIEPDTDFAAALAAIRGSIDTDEIHLTGGEPTLHPRLPDLVAIARRMGLTVGITSNGENGAAALPACAEAGLDRVNLSVFGTTPEELAAVQGPHLASTALAARKLEALHQTVEVALAHAVKVSANIVVPDHSHIQRVLRVVRQYGDRITVRLLTSLSDGHASVGAVQEVLDVLGARPVRRVLVAGASGERTIYRLPAGGRLDVKTIRPVRLPDTCAECRFNNDRDCQEGYYGVRLYRAEDGPFMVGVCIQRMDLCVPLGQFVMSQICREVQSFRDADFGSLSAMHANCSTMTAAAPVLSVGLPSQQPGVPEARSAGSCHAT